jgi:hypothetical protein
MSRDRVRADYDAHTGELPEDVPQVPELMREDQPWPSRSGRKRSAGSRSRGKRTGDTRSTSLRAVARSSS